mmetsp:Transcript_9328/g.15988  ORF Transcript_9328/g.15988 Transcript_9328/m.15988 type:complete len:218 (+) Transcript_9328:150-803(+)
MFQAYPMSSLCALQNSPLQILPCLIRVFLIAQENIQCALCTATPSCIRNIFEVIWFNVTLYVCPVHQTTGLSNDHVNKSGRFRSKGKWCAGCTRCCNSPAEKRFQNLKVWAYVAQSFLNSCFQQRQSEELYRRIVSGCHWMSTFVVFAEKLQLEGSGDDGKLFHNKCIQHVFYFVRTHLYSDYSFLYSFNTPFHARQSLCHLIYGLCYVFLQMHWCC